MIVSEVAVTKAITKDNFMQNKARVAIFEAQL